jgi:hypothetical protein
MEKFEFGTVEDVEMIACPERKLYITVRNTTEIPGGLEDEIIIFGISKCLKNGGKLDMDFDVVTVFLILNPNDITYEKHLEDLLINSAINVWYTDIFGHIPTELIKTAGYGKRFAMPEDPTLMSPELIAYVKYEGHRKGLDFYEFKSKYLAQHLN